jgi:ERCC4-type nuclease
LRLNKIITLNARRSWKNIIQALKESNCQPRLVYTAVLSFLIEGETKTFHKEKLKKFATTKPSQRKILKGLLHIEETRVRPLLSKQTSKQGIGKTKQQAPLNINM